MNTKYDKTFCDSTFIFDNFNGAAEFLGFVEENLKKINLIKKLFYV